MKTAAFVVAASAALVAAQDIKPYIPECAQKCLQSAAASATTCKLQPVLDGKCLCEPATFEKIFQGSVSCVIAACGGDVAVGVVLPGTKKYCEDALAAPPPASSSSSSAPPPASSSSATSPPTSSTSAPTSATASTSATVAPTSSGAGSSTMAPSSSAASSSGTKPTSSSGSGSGSGNSTASSGTGKATSTPVPAGASSASAGFIGLIAAVAFGIFGLL